MEKVLVTGGIGSGKTVVCRTLESLGVPVYYSDRRAKAIYDLRPDIVDTLEASWGIPLRDSASKVDLKAIAAAIFSDREKLLLVESLVHPAVARDFSDWAEARRESAPFVVMESAIALSKPGFGDLFSKVVLVVNPDLERRMSMIMERDGAAQEDIATRMDSQESVPAGKADYIIVNDSTLENLRLLAGRLFNSLQEDIAGGV